VGIYLLMPKVRVSQMRAGAVLGGLALVGLILVLVAGVAGDRSGYFYTFSAISLVSAARVITHTNPVYSALYFVLVVVAVAALLILSMAEFLAVSLIIVYAGAILVTYLFVIMLAQQSGPQTYDRSSREPFVAVLAGFVLMAAVAGQLTSLPRHPDPTTTMITASATTTDEVGNTLAVGRLVMTRYVVALEIAGVLLLVSMVGAVALSRKRVPDESPQQPRKPIGQQGREVEPY